MKHFFERIHAKSLNHGEAPVLIAAFGDSVTEGNMEHGLWDSEAVYHSVTQRLMESFFPGSTFSTINAGFSGDTAARSIVRLDRDVIRHHPDLVFVAFGLNDSLEGNSGKELFVGALNTIVERIRHNTQAAIILVTPPMMAHQPSNRIHSVHQDFSSTVIAAQSSGMLAEYAELIRSVAKEQEILLADVYREWDRLDRSGFPTDQWLINGLNHPGVAGHRLAALVVFNTVMAAYQKFQE